MLVRAKVSCIYHTTQRANHVVPNGLERIFWWLDGVLGGRRLGVDDYGLMGTSQMGILKNLVQNTLLGELYSCRGKSVGVFFLVNKKWPLVKLLLALELLLCFDPDWALLLDVFNGLMHFSYMDTSLKLCSSPRKCFCIFMILQEILGIEIIFFQLFRKICNDQWVLRFNIRKCFKSAESTHLIFSIPTKNTLTRFFSFERWTFWVCDSFG